MAHRLQILTQITLHYISHYVQALFTMFYFFLLFLIKVSTKHVVTSAHAQSFRLVITVGNTFPLVITVGNMFLLVITVENTFPLVMTVRNTFPLVILLLFLLIILYFSLTNLHSLNSSNNLDRLI